ncbi:hypothetical protein QUA43_27205 [Microcoleus sp. N9_B4]
MSGRRKKEEGRRKKEEGRGKKEDFFHLRLSDSPTFRLSHSPAIPIAIS